MYAPAHILAIRGGKQCMHLDTSWHQRWEAMYAPGHVFAIRGGKQCMHLGIS